LRQRLRLHRAALPRHGVRQARVGVRPPRGARRTDLRALRGPRHADWPHPRHRHGLARRRAEGGGAGAGRRFHPAGGRGRRHAGDKEDRSRHRDLQASGSQPARRGRAGGDHPADDPAPPGLSPMRILSRADLERLLRPLELIDALSAAFREFAAGAASVPPRTTLPVGDTGLLLLMPAAIMPGRLEGNPALGTKLVTFYPGNRALGHPTHLAAYVLMDAPTGRPVALMEGTYLTGLRTGAASALAARHLARSDSRRLVCFGTSVQAEPQLHCLAALL